MQSMDQRVTKLEAWRLGKLLTLYRPELFSVEKKKM